MTRSNATTFREAGKNMLNCRDRRRALLERMALARLQCRRKWNAVRRRSPRRTNNKLKRLILLQIRVPESGAFGAHGMGKLYLRTITDVGFDLLPLVAFLNFLARSANGKNARQSFYVREGLL